MSTSAPGDLKAGVKTAWAATSPLVNAIPAASVYSGSVPAGIAPPYASIETTSLGQELCGPATQGEKYLDKYRLTVHVWASGADPEGTVRSTAGLVLDALGNEGWAVPNSVLTACFLGEINHAEDDTYNGDKVWRADVNFEVWLQRTHP